MIWKPCRLYEKVETSKDALGNAIYQDVLVKATRVRETPKADMTVLVEGRTITVNDMFFLIPIKKCMFPDCHKAEVDGSLYEILEMYDYGTRFTVIQVKRYGGDQQ